MNKALLAIPIGIAILTAFIIIQSQQSTAQEEAKWQATMQQTEIAEEQKARAFEQEIFKLTNEVRAQNNKPALQWNDDLAELARLQATKLAAFEVEGHADESYYLQLASCTTHAGENIAEVGAHNSSTEILDGWLRSPSHKQNMLHMEWVFTGIGYVTNNLGWQTVVQAFCT